MDVKIFFCCVPEAFARLRKNTKIESVKMLLINHHQVGALFQEGIFLTILQTV